MLEAQAVWVIQISSRHSTGTTSSASYSTNGTLDPQILGQFVQDGEIVHQQFHCCSRPFTCIGRVSSIPQEFSAALEYVNTKVWFVDTAWIMQAWGWDPLIWALTNYARMFLVRRFQGSLFFGTSNERGEELEMNETRNIVSRASTNLSNNFVYK